MRISPLLAACSLAAACLAFAPLARADSFFVTFSSGTSTIGARVEGAVFEATTTTLPGGGSRPNPLLIEIDDWSVLQPTLDAANAQLQVAVKVEFTAPNPQGQEEVYMIATYQGGGLLHIGGEYDASATPKVKETISLTYKTVKLTAPPIAIDGRAPIRKMPSTAPALRRAARRTAAEQRIDDAYFQAPGFPGESSDHPGQTRLLAVAFDGFRVRLDDQATGPIRLDPVTIKKAPGSASASFQSAVTAHKTVDPVTLTFVQHHGTSPDTTSKTLVLTNVILKSDDLHAGGTNVETIVMVPKRLKLTAGGATTDIAASP